MRANKQPVIHGMIITHFMSANYRMIPFCYPQMLMATKEADHSRACQRASAAGDGDDNRRFFYSALQ